MFWVRDIGENFMGPRGLKAPPLLLYPLVETLLLKNHPKWRIWICLFSRYPKYSRKTIIFLGRFLHPKSLLPISLISQFHHLKQQMVKVLGVKPNSAKAKKSAAKIPVQKSHPQSHSSTTRSNTASIRTGKPILDENEQKNYKKQLQGLVLAKCRLTIQERGCGRSIAPWRPI